MPPTPAVAIPASPEPRRLVGVRWVALLEVIAFIGATLAIDAAFGSGDRFATLALHPFWIPVLLVSAYYGTAEGLTAALLCAAALLVGNVPEQRLDEDVYAWLFHISAPFTLWCLAAVALGGIQRARRSTIETLRSELGQSRDQARTIALACESLQRVKQDLEARVAGQVRTVHSIYKASRAIDRQDVGEVLVGVVDLVGEVLGPRKFSLFLLDGSVLEAAISDGWESQDRYALTFDSSSLVFQAVVVQRRVLVFADPADAALLGNEGFLAGPVSSDETGETVGMLKIEALEFRDLHPASVENFRLLCEWIGTAFANAQRTEALRHSVPALVAVPTARSGR